LPHVPVNRSPAQADQRKYGPWIKQRHSPANVDVLVGIQEDADAIVIEAAGDLVSGGTGALAHWLGHSYKGRPVSIDAAQIKRLSAEMGPAAIVKHLGIARGSVDRLLGEA
jgi:hypothetical protein